MHGSSLSSASCLILEVFISYVWLISGVNLYNIGVGKVGSKIFVSFNQFRFRQGIVPWVEPASAG